MAGLGSAREVNDWHASARNRSLHTYPPPTIGFSQRSAERSYGDGNGSFPELVKRLGVGGRHGANDGLVTVNENPSISFIGADWLAQITFDRN